DHIHPSTETKKGKSEDKPIPKPVFVFDSEHEGASVQLAKCCHPLPGDKIIGIFNSGLGITVHTNSCATAYKFDEMPELWVEVAWPRTSRHRHSGRIKVLLLNEPGSLAKMCTVISQHSGNISFIQLEERKLNYFTFILDIEVADIDHLNNIISVLRSDKFIESAERYSF
ncbi:MAG: ACT domain-containing protein, partial [Pseudomonadota bacterium]|nr:ACT domain-containing protein [Pseudomonadota bacterium]